MQNSASAKYKSSKLELQINVAIVIVFFSQIIMSTMAGLIGATWTQAASNVIKDSSIESGKFIDYTTGEPIQPSVPTSQYCAQAPSTPDITNSKYGYCFLEAQYYLAMDQGLNKESGFPFLAKTGTWILLFTNLIPISLLVSKEIVALF